MEPQNKMQTTSGQVSKTSETWLGQLIDQTPVCKTQREAVFFESPSVALVRRVQADEIRFNALLSEMVADLVLSFNVGKNMDTNQVAKTVETIKTDYYFLKISELKFIFSEASKGRYGKIFDRIDLAIICGWIDEFIVQRDEMITDQRLAEQKLQQTMTPDENTPVISFASILADLKKKEIEELRDKVIERNLIEKPKRELTEHEKIVQGIYLEFDDLHNDPKQSIRTVSYKGKNLNLSEYLTERLNELDKI